MAPFWIGDSDGSGGRVLLICRTPAAPFIAGLLLAVALAGCAARFEPGPSASGGQPEPAAATPADSTPVDAGASRILEAGSAGQRLRYRLADGREAWLVLGPIYQSSRGLPCRIGRMSTADTGNAGPASYPFCRWGDRWYEMKPVVVSGY